ncbi:hypothetical protein GCM10028824_15810 [Hymenobacter segetis]|uniref:DUF2116 family Zn-ribbon domain-containing protein n=1 Tax=Hymenobacter segetis TaxID=2025509 RepID=A0ABU9LQ03_9BACT
MKTPAKTCVICDSPLYGRADKTTCSDACRVRLHRQRQNEDIQEPNEEGNGLSTGHDAPLDLPWLRKQPITSTERDYLNRRDEPEDYEDAAEQKRSNEAALAKQLQGYYVKVVESFLQKEQQRLQSRQLRQMLRTSMDAYESYKLHPQLTQAGSIAQKCQKDLREIIIIIQETHQDAQDGWLSHTSQYELTKKWRRQLQERLLG